MRTTSTKHVPDDGRSLSYDSSFPDRKEQMMNTAEQLRAELSASPDFHYPEDLRRRVARFVQARRADGATWSEIVRALGASQNTLRRWSQLYPTQPVSALSLVRVRDPEPPASASASRGRMALTSPSGWRLDFEANSVDPKWLRELVS